MALAVKRQDVDFKKLMTITMISLIALVAITYMIETAPFISKMLIGFWESLSPSQKFYILTSTLIVVASVGSMIFIPLLKKLRWLNTIKNAVINLIAYAEGTAGASFFLKLHSTPPKHFVEILRKKSSWVVDIPSDRKDVASIFPIKIRKGLVPPQKRFVRRLIHGIASFLMIVSESHQDVDNAMVQRGLELAGRVSINSRIRPFLRKIPQAILRIIGFGGTALTCWYTFPIIEGVTVFDIIIATRERDVKKDEVKDHKKEQVQDPLMLNQDDFIIHAKTVKEYKKVREEKRPRTFLQRKTEMVEDIIAENIKNDRITAIIENILPEHLMNPIIQDLLMLIMVTLCSSEQDDPSHLTLRLGGNPLAFSNVIKLGPLTGLKSSKQISLVAEGKVFKNDRKSPLILYSPITSPVKYRPVAVFAAGNPEVMKRAIEAVTLNIDNIMCTFSVGIEEMDEAWMSIAFPLKKDELAEGPIQLNPLKIYNKVMSQ